MILIRGTANDGVLFVSLTTEQKKEILGAYGLHETDTGSPEAQIAMLTKRISDLTEHLKTHKHDLPTRTAAARRPSPAAAQVHRPGRRRALPIADRAARSASISVCFRRIPAV